MEFLFSAFEMLIIYIVLSNIIRIGYALANRRKIEEKLKEKHQEQQELEEKIEQPVIEKVIDPVCGCEIEKDKAYIVVEKDERKYFCSWDCRQKYIKQKNEN